MSVILIYINYLFLARTGHMLSLQYLLESSNPGVDQNAGIPMNADWSYGPWTPWCNPGAVAEDSTAQFMRVYLLPQSFDLSWPDYQIEGMPIPGDVLDAAVASLEVDRTTNAAAASAGPVPSTAATVTSTPSSRSSAAQPSASAGAVVATPSSLPSHQNVTHTSGAEGGYLLRVGALLVASVLCVRALII